MFTETEMRMLLCLVEDEIERGRKALEARDMHGCAEAMPPRLLLPLKQKIETRLDGARVA